MTIALKIVLFTTSKKGIMVLNYSVYKKHALYTKAPYLKRSYLNNRNVSDLISEKLIGTAILAFASILFASLLGILLGLIPLIIIRVL